MIMINATLSRWIMSSKFNIDKLFLFVYITGNRGSKLKAESSKRKAKNIEVKKLRS